MNKLWNEESRRVLRDMKKCVAVIRGDNVPTRAKEFNDMLGNLGVNPYNGLALTHDWHECKAGLCDSEMEKVYGNLLAMNIKYFQLNMPCGWLRGSCVLERFILRILTTSQSLENLILRQTPGGMLLEPGDWQMDKALLPKLRTIKLGFGLDLGYEDEQQKDKFFEILSRSPNLQEVQNRFSLEWVESLPVGKMHIVKSLRVKAAEEWEDDPEIMRLLFDKVRGSNPKLHSLSLYCFGSFGDLTKERYLNGLISILRSSSESLRMMELDYGASFDLKTIAEYLPLLSNVTKLNLNISATWYARIVHEFQRKPLAPAFANVTTVSLSCAGFSGNGCSFRAEGNQVFPWTTVTAVELKCEELWQINVAELGILFPEARILEISAECPSFQGFEFKQIWSSWPSLEQLSFPGKTELTSFGTANIDATFCGISDEEAAVLQQQDEEYLKAVNIVPIKPAINHHNGLKSLKIELQTETAFVTYEPFPSPSGLFFLSKVTALVALRQMPHLDFQVRIDPEHAQHLEHLKPFVKVLPATPD